ncbi:hypothetical protein HJP15_00370 [Pseudoalteromonas sp. NEC-BIFX-2020_002]|uniref:hypothetical protein n=1 Tax=Pseudoalteromonas sp. NEC-BIFX-2020_002 TaxID=2732353 RepID=UPI001477364E|nr:hypothetical protein [Pseudoalteromonas sp. NEC-BIFX-2020_002]NNG41405.1 hypothetical protein [Pseudoalteromonas sp. NEC-BIFX-2020_002]
MKKDDVPQDNSKSYQGQNKLLYAVDDSGHYQGVKSSGWEIESFATQLAVDDLNEQTAQALEQALHGEISPLAYHMLARRFDIATLAGASGFFQWQIKRHLRPAIFAKLSDKNINRYCDTLKISRDALLSLPSQ